MYNRVFTAAHYSGTMFVGNNIEIKSRLSFRHSWALRLIVYYFITLIYCVVIT